jgi:small subunit ribosomal protein S6
MEKQYSSYETIFICDLSLGDEGVKNLVDKFIGMINAVGKLTGVNEWGKRRLAYPINDLNEGYYVLATFNAPQDFPAELERVYNITEGIMRSMVIKTNPHEAEAAKNEPKIIAPPAEVILGSDDEPAAEAPASKPEAAETTNG